MTTTPTADLSAAGVSIWLDDLSRERIASGGLEKLIAERNVVGVTTNPPIFAGALSKGDAYRAQLHALAEAARGDALARQVVEPDAHPGFGERGGGGVGAHGDVSPSCARQADASDSFAAATTASVVMPNSRNRVL